jgi:phytoene dehydrogenase-like protein
VDAAVVGSGPNGLAAGVLLARAGLSVRLYEAASTVGGGASTAELTLPGFRHDICSSVHPMGLASPFFRAFDLAAHGVEMLQPEVAYAHPVRPGVAGVAWRDLDRTADGLGRDGHRWRRLFRPLVDSWDGVVGTAMSDLRGMPSRPLTAARFGLRVLEQGSPLWNLRFAEDVAPALLTGVSAHAIAPPRRLAPAGAGVMLASLAHSIGWPLPRGGSQAIADALAADLLDHGGKIITGHRVDSLAELAPATVVLFDTGPAEFLRIAGNALPAGYVRSVRRFRYGGAACKVDFAIAGPVPWDAPGCDLAGTLHVVGTRAEAVAAEDAVARGRHADRPYVLAVQPGVVDPGRAPTGRHVLSTYAHVPNGSTVDIGDAVAAQIERFAPGFADVVLARNVITAADMHRRNANYVGGDIAAGAMSMWQTVMRPVPRWDPYRTPLDGVYLCSASTPPGPGVHGMCGLNATRRVLRRHLGMSTDPLDLLRP